MSVLLLTGGAGYIGAHVLRALRAAGHYVVVLDDLSTGERRRVPLDVPFVLADVADTVTVREVLRGHGCDAVVHLAAKKAVDESCADPLLYYRENLGGLLAVLSAMRGTGVARLVFSSSAAVYGTGALAQVDEDCPAQPASPYGRTKLVGEWMVEDCVRAYGFNAVSLRYFNVVGAAVPDLADVLGANLFPRVVAKLSAGQAVDVFGGDYPTPDGTCVRDYIHVEDLARAHVAAAELTARSSGGQVINVGCGQGYSVLDVLSQFRVVSGHSVAHVIRPRRDGDPASVVARADRAAGVLGWEPRHGLRDMVASTWAAYVARGGQVPAARGVTDDVADVRSGEATTKSGHPCVSP